jgi:DNA-binding transcriptional regulator YiaG
MRNNVKPRMKKQSALKELREKAGLSQLEIAATLGVAVSTVHRWERIDEKGIEPALTAEEWLKLCIALGINWNSIPEYFVFSNK